MHSTIIIQYSDGSFIKCDGISEPLSFLEGYTDNWKDLICLNQKITQISIILGKENELD
jgi:hypothetical protein